MGDHCQISLRFKAMLERLVTLHMQFIYANLKISSCRKMEPRFRPRVILAKSHYDRTVRNGWGPKLAVIVILFSKSFISRPRLYPKAG